MEAMDCGWDAVVYQPLKYSLTWELRLQVLLGIARGDVSSSCSSSTFLTFVFLLYFRNDDNSRSWHNSSRLKVCQRIGENIHLPAFLSLLTVTFMVVCVRFVCDFTEILF
jgi:hypothetical protein